MNKKLSFAKITCQLICVPKLFFPYYALISAFTHRWRGQDQGYTFFPTTLCRGEKDGKMSLVDQYSCTRLEPFGRSTAQNLKVVYLVFYKNGYNFFRLLTSSKSVSLFGNSGNTGSSCCRWSGSRSCSTRSTSGSSNPSWLGSTSWRNRSVSQCVFARYDERQVSS